MGGTFITAWYRACAAQVVAPNRAALAEASKRLDTSSRKLQGIRAKVKELSDRVASLEADLMKVLGQK